MSGLRCVRCNEHGAVIGCHDGLVCPQCLTECEKKLVYEGPYEDPAPALWEVEA